MTDRQVTRDCRDVIGRSRHLVNFDLWRSVGRMRQILPATAGYGSSVYYRVMGDCGHCGQ